MNEQLKPALKQEDTILFIGSGISCWAASFVDRTYQSARRLPRSRGRRRKSSKES